MVTSDLTAMKCFGEPVLALLKQEVCLLVRKKWIRRCFCGLTIFAIVVFVSISAFLYHAIHLHSCTELNSREYLDKLVN